MKKVLQLHQHTVYCDNILDSGFDNSEILKICETNLLLNEDSTLNENSTDLTPGEQTKFYIISDEFLKFRKTILQKIKSFLKVIDDTSIYLDEWVYRSTSKNSLTNYHTHDKGSGNLKLKYFPPSHTLTYYISTPNNDDGLLWFKENDKKLSYKPNIGDFLIFPASLKHKPDLNMNSSVDRVVYGANFCIIDEAKIKRAQRKTTKTLI